MNIVHADIVEEVARRDHEARDPGGGERQGGLANRRADDRVEQAAAVEGEQTNIGRRVDACEVGTEEIDRAREGDSKLGSPFSFVQPLNDRRTLPPTRLGVPRTPTSLPVVVVATPPPLAALGIVLTRTGPETVQVDWSDDPAAASFTVSRDGSPLANGDIHDLDRPLRGLRPELLLLVTGYDRFGNLMQRAI